MNAQLGWVRIRDFEAELSNEMLLAAAWRGSKPAVGRPSL